MLSKGILTPPSFLKNPTIWNCYRDIEADKRGSGIFSTQVILSGRKGTQEKGFLYRFTTPPHTTSSPAEAGSEQLRKDVSAGEGAAETEAHKALLFNLLSLYLGVVCTSKKPFSDIGPVGRMTTKRDEKKV